MLLKQPYDSKSLNHIDVNSVNHLVNRYIHMDYGYLLSSKKLNPHVYKKDGRIVSEVILVNGIDMLDEVPELLFPLYLEEKGFLINDMRRYISKEKKSDDLVFKKSHEIPVIDFRNQLIYLWMLGNTKDMYHFKLPHQAFAKWLSSLICQKFGLDYSDEYVLDLLALIYYSRLFSNNTKHDQNELQQLKLRLKGNLYNQDLLDKVFEESKHMETLEDFCDLVPKILNNPRLDGFNPVVLLRLTQTSWLGSDYKQNLALALEFPPIWISMCYQGLVNNIFKRTSIGDRIESMGKRGEAKDFVKELNDFIRLKSEVK